MEISKWLVYAAVALIPLFYFVKTIHAILMQPLSEYFVLWSVARGGRKDRSKLRSSQRLHAYICRTQLLDYVSISELFTLGKELVSSDISIDQFHKVLLQYEYAAFFRDQLDGSLRGMFLIDPQNGLIRHGKCYNCIKMGLALFKDEYRGGPLGYYVICYHLLKALILHPLTPLYVLTKCFSYKSYLFSLRLSAIVYPRYDLEIPPFEKSIIDEFGLSLSNENESYDPTTCVVHRESSRLKTHVAPITPTELKSPHVEYFSKQNPFWDKGHCMIVLCHVTWGSFLGFVVQAIRRQFRVTRQKPPKESEPNRKQRHVLKKQLSLVDTFEQRLSHVHSSAVSVSVSPVHVLIFFNY